MPIDKLEERLKLKKRIQNFVYGIVLLFSQKEYYCQYTKIAVAKNEGTDREKEKHQNMWIIAPREVEA